MYPRYFILDSDSWMKYAVVLRPGGEIIYCLKESYRTNNCASRILDTTEQDAELFIKRCGWREIKVEELALIYGCLEV